MADSISDATGAGDEDRLPWLEAVDDEDEDQGIAPAKLVGGVLAALAVVGLVIAGAFWVRDRNAAGGPRGGAEVIAVDGPYKVKPSEPGGMQVPGQGDASYAASQGADPHSSIDLAAVPEAPVVGKKAAAVPATPSAAAPVKPVATHPEASKAPPVKAAAEAAAVKTPAKPVAKPGSVSGGLIQLGSFSSAAKADAAWTAMSKRFAFLGGLTKSVASAKVNGAAVYRLQVAAGAQAGSVCGKLKVAGESCILVRD